MLSSHDLFGSSQGRHNVPMPDTRQGPQSGVKSQPAHAPRSHLPVHPVHWTPGSTAEVLITGKTARYRAEQIMGVQFFLIYICAVTLPLCKQGG